MKFNLLIRIVSLVTILLGIYLLCYGAFGLWQYQAALIPEAVEKDSHGMSRLVGYTFILMLGVLVLGLGVFSFLLRRITDVALQTSVSLGLFVAYCLAFLMSLFLQLVYWETGWGRLYVAVFLFLALVCGYFRLQGRRA